MAIDNTHTKYLKGTDKRAWEGYKEAYKAQKKLGSFMDGFGIKDLNEGEEIEIPINKKRRKKNN